MTAVFKRPPQLGIGHGKTPEPNQMTFRIEPEPGSRMRMFAESRPATRPSSRPTSRCSSNAEPGGDPEPYERLLGDALHGVHTLFTRQDAIEETWRVVQPLLDDPGPVAPLRARHLGTRARRTP